MFALAIEDGAVPVSPVRDSSARITVDKKSPRALTPKETNTLVALLRADERAVVLDVLDLVDWMLATGCRIGEALALRYGPNADGKPLLDLEANTWEVNATVVRVPRQGLVVQPRPTVGQDSARSVEHVRRPTAVARLVRLRRVCWHRLSH